MLVKLGEISTFINGYAFKSKNFIKQGIPIVRIGNIDNDEIDLENAVCYEESIKLESYIVLENDILIAMSGATTGKIAYSHLYEKSYLNQRIGLVRANEKTIPSYIFYFLKREKEYLLNLASGSAQPNLSSTLIKNLLIPLPPLKQQKAIAKKLDQAKELIELRKSSIEKLDVLAKSVFIDMFGDPVANEMGWEVKKLESFGDWKGGGTPTRKEPKYFKGDIPWITTVSLGKLFIDIKESAEFITEEAVNKSATKIIPKNSVIIGTRVGVGKVAINKDELCTNQDIMSLINVKDFINNIYIYYTIKHINQILKEEQRGATIQGITSKFLKNIDLAVPPITLQNKFAKTIEKIETQKALYEQELLKLEEVFESLLNESFA